MSGMMILLACSVSLTNTKIPPFDFAPHSSHAGAVLLFRREYIMQKRFHS